MDEEGYMAQALQLADAADGSVAPRPPVGALVVAADGEIVGRGRTRRRPGPHAEAEALAEAGDRAEGATVYATLEPCTLTVNKPRSCVDLLVAAKVSRVVAPITDPCPDVDGRGVAALREAGIEVRTGLLADRAAELIAPFAKWTRTGLPLVTLKLAASLDGKLAAPDGTSRWITGPQARADVHDLRRRADAILVGSGTVLADDPQLTARTGDQVDQPLRVVLDSTRRVPASAKVFDEEAETLVLTADDVPPADGGLDLPSVLRLLGDRGVCNLLVEGGPTLAGALVRQGLVDRFVVYLAPILLGGDAPGMLGDGVKTLAQAWKLRIDGVRPVGPDLRVDARPEQERR